MFPRSTRQLHPVWRLIPAIVAALAALIAGAQRPAFIVGSDVYWDGAWDELAAAAGALGVPCFFNGMGRGLLPADHALAFLRTRGLLKQRADVVVVLGTPLDFRIGFGSFGSATVAHVVDAESQRAGHIDVLTVVGNITATLTGLADHAGARVDHTDWIAELRDAESRAAAGEVALMEADGDPIKPSRIYGELRRRLERDAVVICDGGDFASYAGKFIEVFEPGGWLDTGPYGCLGNGLGYAIAARVVRPSSQVVLLLGDGAAGFSLMDVDSLVRHGLPVVMIVGNNGMWGLEKHPMQAIYGWDMACDLQPGCRYDEVVKSLGGGGETVSSPAEIGPALDRAFASGVPYLVNVLTDPADIYPRTRATSPDGQTSEMCAEMCTWRTSERIFRVMGRCVTSGVRPQTYGRQTSQHLAMKRSRSTSTRVILPAATSPPGSDAETVNFRRRPSIFSSNASAITSPPTGVGWR